MTANARFYPSGDQCLIVEFGESINLETNEQVCLFAARVTQAALQCVVDVVPAFANVGIHYVPGAVPRSDMTSPFNALCKILCELLPSASALVSEAKSRTIEIPVCYGGEFGPDLEEVATATGRSPKSVVELHGAVEARVFMIGFAPGHPYLGLWDKRLDVPRRRTPRTQVAAGSVAIANRQCVIYPFDLPSGWNVIGRTPLKMFDLSRRQSCLLAPGDRVRFVQLSIEEYEASQRGKA